MVTFFYIHLLGYLLCVSVYYDNEPSSGRNNIQVVLIVDFQKYNVHQYNASTSAVVFH
nr:MAG TPA: hypothetical protein [Caudoviricetes sp.]